MKQLQSEIKKLEIKIKVIEKSGTKIVRLLQKNDPFKEKTCTDAENCLVCSEKQPGGCRNSGVTYKIECNGDCSYEYDGQTGQNAYTRGCSHQEDFNEERDDSVLWKHCVNNRPSK